MLTCETENAVGKLRVCMTRYVLSANGKYELQENDLRKGNANVLTVKNFYTWLST